MNEEINSGVKLSATQMECVIEALLFASGEAVSTEDIARALQLDLKTVRSMMQNMSDKYDKEKRGIKLVQVNDLFQFCTNDVYYEYVQKLIKSPSKKILTQTLLETLAIIAYKQPVIKAQIEEIRGVNADHAVNKLLEYGLITEKGRMDSPGKPILFGTTDEFLKVFGFKTLSQMPALNNDVDELKNQAMLELEF